MDGFPTMYRVMLLLHLVAVVAAFAPIVTYPLLAARARAQGPDAQRWAYRHLARSDQLVHLPALLLVGLFGLGMVFSSKPGASDENLFGFDQVWVSLALLLWLAIVGVVSGLVLPAERRLAAGEGDAEAHQRKIAVGGQVVTVLFLVVMYLMIWKPGL